MIHNHQTRARHQTPVHHWRALLLTSLLLAACGSDEQSDSSLTSSPQIGSATEDSLAETSLPDEPTSEIDTTDLSYFYFSYDDSASTASRDLTLFYLDQGQTPLANWGRAYEYLNAETFGAFNSQTVGPFEVSIGAYNTTASELMVNSEHAYFTALGIDIQGPSLSKDARDNLVLTLLVDTSGSMDSPFYNGTYETIDGLDTRIELVKYGLDKLRFSLKAGDVVNLVEFNTAASTLLEGWHYDLDSGSDTVNTAALANYFDQLVANGSTNLDAGIQQAYRVALRTFDASKDNRVIMLTDAYANTGETNVDVIANNLTLNDQEGIYFSGIGIGADFDSDFLDELTDAGKGTYSAMVTPADASRLFGDGFMRFVDVAVRDVLFMLDYPQNWDHGVSAAEESSTDADAIQTINYSYNSEQFFFEAFSADTEFASSDEIILQIRWKDNDGVTQQDSLTVTMGDILDTGTSQIQAAAAVTALAELVSTNTHCSDIAASGLLTLNNEHGTYLRYKTAIEDYCSITSDVHYAD